MNTLTLAWRDRDTGEKGKTGSFMIGRGGATYQTPCRYLDFVVDGHSLFDQIGGDWASCLGWFHRLEDLKSFARLLGLEEPDVLGGRCSLYVCPECGDPMCGVVGAKVALDDETATWSDFADVWRDTEEFVADPLELGPFTFERSEYERVLRAAIDLPREAQADPVPLMDKSRSRYWRRLWRRVEDDLREGKEK